MLVLVMLLEACETIFVRRIFIPVLCLRTTNSTLVHEADTIKRIGAYKNKGLCLRKETLDFVAMKRVLLPQNVTGLPLQNL